MMRSVMSRSAVVLLLLAVPAMARGQNSVSPERLSELLPNLYLNSIDATILEFERIGFDNGFCHFLDKEGDAVRLFKNQSQDFVRELLPLRDRLHQFPRLSLIELG